MAQVLDPIDIPGKISYRISGATLIVNLEKSGYTYTIIPDDAFNHSFELKNIDTGDESITRKLSVVVEPTNKYGGKSSFELTSNFALGMCREDYGARLYTNYNKQEIILQFKAYIVPDEDSKYSCIVDGLDIIYGADSLESAISKPIKAVKAALKFFEANIMHHENIIDIDGDNIYFKSTDKTEIKNRSNAIVKDYSITYPAPWLIKQ